MWFVPFTLLVLAYEHKLYLGHFWACRLNVAMEIHLKAKCIIYGQLLGPITTAKYQASFSNILTALSDPSNVVPSQTLLGLFWRWTIVILIRKPISQTPLGLFWKWTYLTLFRKSMSQTLLWLFWRWTNVTLFRKTMSQTLLGLFCRCHSVTLFRKSMSQTLRVYSHQESHLLMAYI